MSGGPFTRLEVRGLRREDVAKPLVAEFGGIADGDAVRGAGWLVRIDEAEPASVGRIRVSVLMVEVDGERAVEVAAFLRTKLMRGGG